jgi:hypothetical protein
VSALTDTGGTLKVVAVGLLVAVAVRPRPWPGALVGLLADPVSTRRRPTGLSPSGRRSWRPRRAPRSDAGDIVNSLDLLAVALSSGSGLHQALLDVAEFGGPGEPLASAAARLQRGVPLLEVLDALPGELGAEWIPVVTTLGVTATSGAPAIDAVRRMGAGLRVRRRRRCEQRIRRLPVLLLLPLATLMLPAFVLVTFVPVAVAIAGRSGW